MTDQTGGHPNVAGGASATRVLLLSEYFPRDAETHVNGVYQRLRSHVVALQRVGAVDLVFFWSGGQPVAKSRTEGEAAFRAAWGFEGRIWFIPTDRIAGRPPRERLTDWLWALRGAVGFFSGKPTQRTGRAPQIRALEKILSAHNYDLVFAHRVAVAAALVRLGSRSPRFVVDFDDLEHVKFSRRPSSERTPGAWIGRMWTWTFALRAERLAAGRAAISLVCSEADRRRLLKLSPDARIAVVANSADPNVLPSEADEPIALFVGAAHYEPNSDGVRWLVARVWPRIRARMPSARLVIVGVGSRELGIEDESLGIRALGFQKDLAQVYGQAAIALAPIHGGGGTRIKIIEAAMHALPVVSTTIGAEGLDFVHDAEIVIADDAAAFAEACLMLLGQPKKRREIGLAARVKALQEYSPRAIRDRLISICEDGCRISGCPAEFR